MSTPADRTRERITIERETRPVTVLFGTDIIASSDEALILKETGHDPVIYIPKKHVAMDFLHETDHTSICPYKGEARYWTISASNRAAENAVWSYDNPNEGVEAIAGHVAFDREKLRIEVG